MSPLTALRSLRSSDDLPPAATDEDLLAWSSALTRSTPTVRRAPRTEPLRAERRRPVEATLDSMSLEELFHEIEMRATASATHRRR